MRFHQAQDDPKNCLFDRRISDNGLIEIGVSPVLFGFRVRAGFVGRSIYELDWCAGAAQENLEELYGIAEAILSQREESNSAFDGIPTVSERKPYFNDPNFSLKVRKLAGPFEPADLSPVSSTRRKMLASFDEKRASTIETLSSIE